MRRACLVLAAVAMNLAACAGQTPPPELTPAQKVELATLRAQLADPTREPKTKREAAILLLTRTYPQATACLREFLSDQTNRPAQIAVAEGIAETGQTPLEFVKPLLAMLAGTEPSVRAPAAGALSAYKEPQVLAELTRRAADRGTDRDQRLAIIAAMYRVLDKQAVDALVGLLDDPDEAIAAAAGETLARLTNIRAFGQDRKRWKSWWERNKDKPHSDWLADLADSLARTNTELERENAELRRRLAEVTNALYLASPATQRDAFLAAMLKDPLAEVRLAATRLMQQRLTASEPLPEPLRAQVRARMGDSEPSVRRAAALLLAGAADAQAVTLLTDRLSAEQAPEVREGIYQALGLLRDASVWDRLVEGVAEADRRVAAAAAAALAQVAERNASGDGRRQAAAEALKKRYAACVGEDSSGLREALLGAMGALKDASLAGLMTTALKDTSAAVRLSAVKGLQRLGTTGSGSAISALAADADPGVRLAAVSALGTLGDVEHLETVLARTDARTESDAAVRNQAWTVAMGLLAKADTPRMAALADRLAARTDAGEHLVTVLRLWGERIPPEKTDQWVPVRLRLGEALLAQNRPAEAAGELAKVYEALVKSDAPEAGKVWLRWMEALLTAGDASAVTRIAEVKEPEAFATALSALEKRLAALEANKDWDAVVRLAAASVERLAARLDDARRQRLDSTLQKARQQQRLGDRQRVSELVARLTGPDKSAAAAAEKELAAMKDRAVAPLLAELRREASAEKPDPAAEKAILDLLAVLAPQLKGYDAKASAPEKLKLLDRWAESLGS